MRELDLEAADDDDDDVAAATTSAFGFNNAILLSSRCCMTMQRTCETNFPSTCSTVCQSCSCTACARCVYSVCVLMAAAADLLPHAPRVVQVHVKRGLQVKHCTHLMQQRDGVTCDVIKQIHAGKQHTALATLTAEGAVSVTARLAARSSAFLRIRREREHKLTEKCNIIG